MQDPRRPAARRSSASAAAGGGGEGCAVSNCGGPRCCFGAGDAAAHGKATLSLGAAAVDARAFQGGGRDHICPECGKAFLSDKAMYGHLRVQGVVPPVDARRLLRFRVRSWRREAEEGA